MNAKFTLVKESIPFTENALICIGKNQEQKAKLERNMLLSIRKLLEEHPNCLEDEKILEFLKREVNIKNARSYFPNYYHYTSSKTFMREGANSTIISCAKVGNFTLYSDMIKNVTINEIPILIDDFIKEDSTTSERIRKFYLYRKHHQDIVCDMISVTSINGYYPITEVYPVRKKVYSLDKKQDN